MKQTKIIAIVGMPGSGKSTCADYFKKSGFTEVYFGGIVVETVKSRNLEINEKNERSVREELREQEGMAVMAKRSLPKIDSLLAQNQKIVIDDMYSFDEYKLLGSVYKNELSVVAIVAPKDIRYARLAVRPKRSLGLEEASSRDYSQIENLDIGGSIAIADHYILNSGSLADFKTGIQRVAKELA